VADSLDWDEELLFFAGSFNGFKDKGLMLYNLFVLIFIQFKLGEPKPHLSG